MTEQAKKLIKLHEGFRTHPYRCTAGKLTIGYGRNLDDVGILETEAEHMLGNDMADCCIDLARYGFWAGCNEARKSGSGSV